MIQNNTCIYTMSLYRNIYNMVLILLETPSSVQAPEVTSGLLKLRKSLPCLREGEEVMARWSDEGWYFRGKGSKPVHIMINPWILCYHFWCLWIDLQLIFFGKQVVISFISYRNQNWPKSKNICKHYLLYEYKFQVFIVEI